MKQYTCPDCGKTWNETAPEICPACGCPSDFFEVKTVADATKENQKQKTNTSPKNDENGQTKIYYSDSICKIGDKIWEFEGLDSQGAKTICIFPVHNISAVVLGQKYPKWWIWLIIGLLSLIIIVGLIFIIVAFVLKSQKVLKVLSTDSESGFIFDNISSVEEAQKYIIPMRQCLLEHKY